jgi:hypothetical protein
MRSDYWRPLQNVQSRQEGLLWCIDDSGVVRDQDVEALFQKHGYDLGFRECDQNMKCVPLQSTRSFFVHSLLFRLAGGLQPVTYPLDVSNLKNKYKFSGFRHPDSANSLDKVWAEGS